MRGKQAPVRITRPDFKYGSVVVSKLVNYVMHDGKKTVAERIVYDAFEVIEKKTKQKSIDVFDTAMKNVMPAVEVKSKRVGGANYQIPVPVRGERRQALAFRWMLAAARARKGKPMAERLATEIMDAANNEGSAVKKRQDVQKMADANRAFAHFARR